MKSSGDLAVNVLMHLSFEVWVVVILVLIFLIVIMVKLGSINKHLEHLEMRGGKPHRRPRDDYDD